MNHFRNFKFSSNITNNEQTCQQVSLSSLTPSQTRILDKILILGNKHTYVFPNQTTLGKSAGVGLRQAHRIVKQLCEWGLLEKLTRPNLACVYRVPKFLLNPKIRQQYRDKFEAFRWLPLVLLFCPLFNLGVVRTISAIRFLKTDLITDTSNINKLTDSKRTVGMYSSEARSKLIIEIGKDLRLSRLGQVKLAPYPLECLQYCQEQFRRVKNPKDSFKFFVYLCNEWCKINDVPQDWKACYDLYEKLKLNPNGSFYDESLPVKQHAYYQSSSEGKKEQKWESKSSYSSSKPTGKATDYGHVSFGFPPMTREEYNDPELSKKYSLALKEHNKQRNLTQAQERGDQKEIDALNVYDTAITRESTPGQYRFVTDLYRSVSDKLKQEWLDNPHMVPDTVAEPLTHVLQEFKEGIVISAMPDNILTDISRKLSANKEVEQITDYSQLEEEFDVGFL